VGLLIILWYRFDLYTGKIGYINSPKEIPIMFIILLGNFIGCGVMFFVSGSAVGTVAAAIMAHKYQIDLYELFIRSVFCGILIYVAVD
jgi:formate/nitrite transporter FocA (FNT family)